MIRPDLIPRFDDLRTALLESKSVILSTHINPDGDGLGSQIALTEYIASTGARPLVLNHDGIPDAYAFLDPDGLHLRRYDVSQDEPKLRNADLILIVDTNHTDRLGSLSPFVRSSPARKIIIDHHLDPDPTASIIVSDDNACATGEVVYRFLEHVGALPLSKRAATALYTAIMTDTGSFRFPKTDASVHRIAAHLIECGADPVAVYGSVYERGRQSRIRLLGRVLSTLRVTDDGLIGSMYVTEEMFRQTDSKEKDTDTFVTYPLTIGGVRVSLMVTELNDGIKLNVRTKGDIPANSIAKAFGGNGHINAAGARITPGPVEEILAKAIKIAASYCQKGKSQ